MPRVQCEGKHGKVRDAHHGGHHGANRGASHDGITQWHDRHALGHKSSVHLHSPRACGVDSTLSDRQHASNPQLSDGSCSLANLCASHHSLLDEMGCDVPCGRLGWRACDE